VVCPHCRSVELVGTVVSGLAHLSSWTIVERAFHPWFGDKVPYLLVTAELDEQPGLMFLTRLVGCDEATLAPGMALEVTFEPLDDDVTVPLFRPRNPRSVAPPTTSS
jgi:uncharacterized OB-fold protein